MTSYVVPLPAEEERLRAKAVDIVERSPDQHTRTELASHLGTRKRTALQVVARLIADGVLGPDKPKSHLRVMQPLPERSEPIPAAGDASDVA